MQCKYFLLSATVLLLPSVLCFVGPLVPSVCLPSRGDVGDGRFHSCEVKQKQHDCIARGGVWSRRFCFSVRSSSRPLSDLEALKSEEGKLLRKLKQVRQKKLDKLRQKPQRIVVVGFGRFGQFIASTFQKYGEVVAVSRSDYSDVAKKMGVSFYRMNDFGTVLEQG